MLDLQILKAMPPGTAFATGTALDNPDGLYMANTGKELRWVAIRGDKWDWAIYCHFVDSGIDWIKRFGDKVCDEKHIRKLVPCDDESYEMYRR